MDGIIFDVDGTLWDSTDSVTESWNLAIRENSDMDLTITADILKGLFGKTMTEIADSLFPSLPEKERMDFLDICYDYENRHLEAHPGDLYEGVVETIRKLAEKYPLLRRNRDSQERDHPRPDGAKRSEGRGLCG